MRVIDLTGSRFGRWYVVSRGVTVSRASAFWRCVCACGVEREVSGNNLRRGLSKSCGCAIAEVAAARLEDLSGRVFGRLTVGRRVGRTGSAARWECLCTCGGLTTAYASSLKAGKTTSCGCAQRDKTAEANRTHGMSKTPTYTAWLSMRRRCENATDPSYGNYGGRGIAVDPRWGSFDGFLADMGTRPEGTTLDRVDNTRGYEPGNCRWATPKEQAVNRSTTLWVSAGGAPTCLKDACKSLGLSYKTVHARWVRTGDMTWASNGALTTAEGDSHAQL